MRTEDAGDYGGTCDTCANGVAKAGHQQCMGCERLSAEVDAHYDAVNVRETACQWTWVQPTDNEALLERLAIARDFAVPERERENLCSCAHTALKRLLAERATITTADKLAALAAVAQERDTLLAALRDLAAEFRRNATDADRDDKDGDSYGRPMAAVFRSCASEVAALTASRSNE